jgi:hypothetical protein
MRADLLFFSSTKRRPSPTHKPASASTCRGSTGLTPTCKKRLRVVQDIQTRPWGSRMALYADATSNRVWLSEKIADEH